MKCNNSFIGKCLHNVLHNVQLQCCAFKLASMNLGVSDSDRYGSVLYHGTIVCLLYCFQHAWFHCTRQSCGVNIWIHTQRFNCIFV